MTANERFKRRARRLTLLAAAAALALHAAILFLSPTFKLDVVALTGHGPRMIVTLREWSSPTRAVNVDTRAVAYDTTMMQPLLVNMAELRTRLPRLYPWILWKYQEPSRAVVQVAIGRSGRVRDAVILESSANGADAALLELVRIMRFEPLRMHERPIDVVGQVEVGVVPPQ